MLTLKDGCLLPQLAQDATRKGNERIEQMVSASLSNRGGDESLGQ